MVAQKYVEHLDKSLPLYGITGLDNLLSPFDQIPIQLIHARNDGNAIEFAHKLAEEQKWHSWEICQGKRKVFFINTNTGEEWPKKKKRK